MLDGHGGGGMTVPHGDLETTLRRELTAAVGGVEPASDALERIRARTARRPPQPWLLSVVSGAVSRARYWVWHGHWAWPESLPRPRAVAWPGAGWATRAQRAMGGNWLRPVAALAGDRIHRDRLAGGAAAAPGDRSRHLYRADRRPDVRRCGHRRQRHAERGRRRDADQRRAQHGGRQPGRSPEHRVPWLEGRVAVPAGRGRRDASWIERADRGGRLVRPARYPDAGVRLPDAHRDGQPDTDGHRNRQPDTDGHRNRQPDTNRTP